MKFQEFIDFLVTKGVGEKCPSCGAASWQTSNLPETGEDAAMTFGLVAGTTPEANPAVSDIYMTSRPVVPVMCNNCGYLRLYDYAFAQRWINENAGKK